MPGYEPDTLMKVAKSRGYYSKRSVVESLHKVLGIGKSTIYRKVKGDVPFNLSECCVIASTYEMTPREFCEVFLSGLFIEDSTGRYTAYVGDPGRFLHERNEEILERRQKRKEERLEDLRKFLEDLE